MTELLLPTLQRQALLLSVGALLLLALRPLLLKRLGARATYAAWLLLPTLLVTPLLPSLGAKPLPMVVTVAELARTAAAPLLTTPHAEALWPRLLLAIWLSGTALVLSLQALRQWRLARHGMRLPAGASPALVGLWKPHVALPADFEQRFSSDERQLILAHEDVHRARHDNAWNLLATLLTALHWWNPLAWLAAHRMQADQELACDAVVLATRPEAQADYIRALLAAHNLTTHGAPLASRWGTTHPLVERITMLNRPTLLTRRRAGVIALAMAGTVGLAYAAQTPALSVPPETDSSVRLTVLLIVQEGNHVRRTSKTLLSKSGERVRMEMTFGGPPVNVDLTPTALNDKNLRLEVALEGLPPALNANGQRVMLAGWGDPVLFESIDEKATSRLSVFVIGNRVSTPPEAAKPKS